MTIREPDDDAELLGPALDGTIGVLKSAKDRYVIFFAFFLMANAIHTVLP